MQFYSFCFDAWFGGGVCVYDDFDKYMFDLETTISTISGGDIDTYKFCAWNEDEAYEKAKCHYKEKGWKL